MTFYSLLATAAAALAQAGVEDSHLEAELLLRHCLSVSRSGLFLLHKHEVTPEQARQFHELLRRRCQREPLQYITGSCEFWSLTFLVNAAVLIPRPETEFLLEHVLAVLAVEQCQPQQILDLCTGSGVIATVLAKELPHATVTALDCSLAALSVARNNVLRHQLESLISFLCADLLTALRPEAQFDLIVSNPPYIKANDIPTLEPEVRDWEPQLALSGGTSGMEIIDLICTQGARHLRPGGWLFMEIGADLEADVKAALLQTGAFEQIEIIPDWVGRPRVAQGKKR
ncbi:MAG: release factor glutamine methyltransferase [Candidatus Electronema aureum]|uniref:Release factor glutamine methyltransferase n=1 Tax=Candidatus Electronema aureum TaxID=2005002 RepID=A0A521G2C8_9BACT|nr:MAG: release factor glutamine methyltransferase [Candidatus Electronema aureum]